MKDYPVEFFQGNKDGAHSPTHMKIPQSEKDYLYTFGALTGMISALSERIKKLEEAEPKEFELVARRK